MIRGSVEELGGSERRVRLANSLPLGQECWLVVRTLSPQILAAFPPNGELFVVSKGWIVIGDSREVRRERKGDYWDYKLHRTRPGEGFHRHSFSQKGQRPRGRLRRRWWPRWIRAGVASPCWVASFTEAVGVGFCKDQHEMSSIQIRSRDPRVITNISAIRGFTDANKHAATPFRTATGKDSPGVVQVKWILCPD